MGMAGSQDTGLYLPAAEQGLAGVSAGTPGSCPCPYPSAKTLSTLGSPSTSGGARRGTPAPTQPQGRVPRAMPAA